MSAKNLAQAMLRGARQRCPTCGDGKLFRSYLKVDAQCAACGHENGRYRADDAPPYFTIFLIGHVVIAPLLLFPWIWEANPVLVVGTILPLLAVLTLLTLPIVKGAVVGLMTTIAAKDSDEPVRP